MRKLILNSFSFVLLAALYGCGGADPGSTVKDDTPGGEATEAISEDPNEVAGQMGDGYATDNK